MSTPKIVFAGTPEFAAVSLKAVLDAGFEVAAVYTQPDRPAGRGRKLLPSPVKALAVESGIPVFQPQSLRTGDASLTLAELNPDLMIVVAYGLILPQHVLDTPRLGCVNVHASILPCWRGAAPIQHAILAGDAESGISIMQMDVGLDTGPVVAERRLTLAADETGESLHDRLAALGGRLLVDTLPTILNGETAPVAQDDTHSTYAGKIDKGMAEIDWTRPAVEIDRLIRAFNPWPVAFTDRGDPEDRLRVWQARPAEGGKGRPGEILEVTPDGILVAAGKDSLWLLEVQAPGGKRLSVRDYLNANLLKPGEIFGSAS